MVLVIKETDLLAYGPIPDRTTLVLLDEQGVIKEIRESDDKFECTVSFGAAKTILDALAFCYSEGVGPEGPEDEAVMRAIAQQHPSLVEEYCWLPWEEVMDSSDNAGLSI